MQSELSAPATQSGAKFQRGETVEPHVLRPTAVLSDLIDELVRGRQARTGETAEEARRVVEAEVLRLGVAAVQEVLP